MSGPAVSHFARCLSSLAGVSWINTSDLQPNTVMQQKASTYLHRQMQIWVCVFSQSRYISPCCDRTPSSFLFEDETTNKVVGYPCSMKAITQETKNALLQSIIYNWRMPCRTRYPISTLLVTSDQGKSSPVVRHRFWRIQLIARRWSSLFSHHTDEVTRSLHGPF